MKSFALIILLGLSFTAPEGWKELPKSGMRVADYKLPAAEGAADEAQVTVYDFGALGGGSADSNVQRWLGQFDPKDGDPKIEKPKDEDKLKITLVEVGGTYVAETRPGSGVKNNKPGWAMIAAVVEGGGKTLFVKAVGPKATIEKQADAIRAYIRGAKAD
jgi:hypothetical protein